MIDVLEEKILSMRLLQKFMKLVSDLKKEKGISGKELLHSVDAI